ncbi:hypothetical protein LF887_15440 [Chryseobacterium sp. MEBOG06]|uniref:hypothetical protein n=1 Tax=Chryseobacterium sp. MEBOG06 TaxID=2879938 RepID=UPI001F40A298|nr:hypothetical protein [Chryseobacterium sp. MEBOG06]UKB82397.1 hypothetical protein LF887_15440 [Chryseobacterium sp. MEBOG06]
MSYFNGTLLLLKEKKDPKLFILDFNEKLKSINVLLQKSDSEIVVFNDSRNEEEKEPIWLDKLMTDEDVINLVYSWKGLGLLTYRHPDFKFEMYINYLTWDDKYVDGFKVSFARKDTVFEDDRHKELIAKISKFVDYEYVVGDVNEESQNYISMEESLDEIKQHILKNSFEIDSRTW